MGELRERYRFPIESRHEPLVREVFAFKSFTRATARPPRLASTEQDRQTCTERDLDHVVAETRSGRRPSPPSRSACGRPWAFRTPGSPRATGMPLGGHLGKEDLAGARLPRSRSRRSRCSTSYTAPIPPMPARAPAASAAASSPAPKCAARPATPLQLLPGEGLLVIAGEVHGPRPRLVTLDRGRHAGRVSQLRSTRGCYRSSVAPCRPMRAVLGNGRREHPTGRP